MGSHTLAMCTLATDMRQVEEGWWEYDLWDLGQGVRSGSGEGSRCWGMEAGVGVGA